VGKNEKVVAAYPPHCRTALRCVSKDRCASSAPYDERGRTRATRTTVTASPTATAKYGSSSAAIGTLALVRRARPHPDYERVEEGS
jgi:hypothetical protein